MPEIPNVVTDTTVESEWGNAIRDRVLSRYADATERATEASSPTPGELSYLENTGEVDLFHAGQWRHLGAPTGSMQMLAGGAVPIGWLLCNGSAVSRTTYAALFAQIGTTWGAGDGSTTFALPDMRGRVPRGVAASGAGNAIGEAVGADTHAHAGPSHSHTGPSHSHPITDTTTSAGAHTHTLESGYAKLTTHPTETHFYRKDTETYTINRNTGENLNLFPNSVSAATDTGTGLGGDSGSGGGHTHAFTGSSAAAGTGNTGAGGTQTGGAASTIPAGRAVNFIIKT